MQTLSGKVVLVTGASQGIGKGIAVALGEAGAKVYLTGRPPSTRLAQSVKQRLSRSQRYESRH